MRRMAALAALALTACPRAPLPRPPPLPLDAPAHHDEPALAGIVHVVRRGETIWRIARAYGIDPADLMETNGVADPHAVEIGTELFVPGASRVVEVEPAPGVNGGATSTATPTATSTATPTSTLFGRPARPTTPASGREFGSSLDP